MELSENARKIFKDLYCFQGETIEDTFRRVAKDFGKDEEEEKITFELLSEGIWRPNTPVFLNAGTKHKVFSACYVVGLEDSMESIYDIANVARKIFQFGAGIGIPIGNLREKDAYIYEGNREKPPEGQSSGPLSFMKLYDSVGETTKSGGRVRRAAILCALPVWHPDVKDFINCKEIDGRLANMNISVLVTDKFMQALADGTSFNLHTPADGAKIGEVDTLEIWNRISDMAHKSADPGVIFIDEVNRYNPLRKDILIETCNPSLRKNTKVLTSDGIFNIQDLENEKFKVLTLNNIYSSAKCFLSGKNKRLYKIKLLGGHEYYSTVEHKWPVLENGEYIKKTTLELKKGSLIPDIKQNSLNYGSLGDYSDGFIVGWNLGDGWITKRSDNGKIQYGFIMSKNEENIRDIICDKLKSITENNYNPKLRKGCYEINSSAIKLNEYFKKFKLKNKKYGLPDVVWNQGSEEFRKGLIDGLISSDGSVDVKHNRIQFTSSCKKLVNDLSELLGFYGIRNNIGMIKRDNILFSNNKIYDKTYKLYYLNITKSSSLHFRNIFNLSNKDKKKKLDMITEMKKSSTRNNHCSVIKVEETNLFEDVWDITVFDNTHTFKLSNCITGNCGEQFLTPFNCCNLSAINLLKFIRKNGTYDWNKLYNTAKKVAKLMDNTIDVMAYPDSRFEETTKKYRPIGVGPMGLADTLFALDLKYDGPDGRDFAATAMKTITTACLDTSTELAKINGPFHNYDRYKEDVERITSEHTGNNEKVMAKIRKYGLRNQTVTTCQPTGTTALSCDASYGIEPMFGLVFKKNLISGETMNIVNPIFESRFKRQSWYSDTLLGKIAGNGGSLKGIHGIPKEVRDVFIVAHDIGYKARIDMQSELQKHCSTAISSTINLSKDTTKAEVAELFRYAYEKHLKGVTIYRDGSKKNQPVSFNSRDGNGHEEFHRPNRMKAETFTVETANGKMYVTISDDNGKPVEVFLFLGKSGQTLNTFTEALGRLFSLALQSGVPVAKLTKTLRGINSDSPVWHKFEPTDLKPAQILSIPDGIAKLLDKYYLNVTDVSNGGSSDQICPKCGLNMTATEGCFSCICGYSKCS